MSAILESPLLYLAMTIGIFSGFTLLKDKTKQGWINPFLFTIIVIVSVLIAFDIPYSTYQKGGSFISMFLTPVTSLLALSIYRERKKIKENLLPILLGTTVGAVKKEVLRQLEYTPGGVPIAIDAIALFDGGLAEVCDVTVAVTAPEDVRVQRLTARDNITEAQALQRIRAQKEASYFANKCDHILENNSTQADFQEKCLAFFRQLSIIKENR